MKNNIPCSRTKSYSFILRFRPKNVSVHSSEVFSVPVCEINIFVFLLGAAVDGEERSYEDIDRTTIHQSVPQTEVRDPFTPNKSQYRI